MRQKIIAITLGIGLVGIAAIGAYASQDSVHTQDVTPTATNTVPAPDTATATATGQPSETPEATETREATETAEATDTATPSVTGTPRTGKCEDDQGDNEGDDAHANATATATPNAGTGCNDEGHGDREVKGIPTGNPEHHPDDGDGHCQKDETAIKTAPAGFQVNIPCQATGDHQGHDDNGD